MLFPETKKKPPVQRRFIKQIQVSETVPSEDMIFTARVHTQISVVVVVVVSKFLW